MNMCHWFITGATGFIGQALIESILSRGDRITALRRSTSRFDRASVDWVSSVQDLPESVDVIVNLAGEGIADARWSAKRRKSLIESRVTLTQGLAKVANEKQVAQIISASAVGFYGSAGEVDEGAAQGKGFAAQLCADWEAAAAQFNAPTAIVRLGVVLGPGGFLNRTLLPFSMGLGGRIGSGRQGFSWIHRDDVIRMIHWLVEHQKTGVYNASGPQACTNRDMTQALARAAKRPAFIPAPALALKAAFGQMAEELLIQGQQALPARALSEGFEFSFESIELAMADAVAKKRLATKGG